MDKVKELKLLLDKVAKIVPTVFVTGRIGEDVGTFYVTSQGKTEEEKSRDIARTIAMNMENNKVMARLLLAAICWFMEDKPVIQETMKNALKTMEDKADE